MNDRNEDSSPLPSGAEEDLIPQTEHVFLVLIKEVSLALVNTVASQHSRMQVSLFFFGSNELIFRAEGRGVSRNSEEPPPRPATATH